MGRKRRETNGESLIKLAARLPWWLAVLLAALAYFILQAVANSPLPEFKPGSIPMASVMARSFAAAGQYVIPLILLAGAIGSFFISRNRRQLLDRVAMQPTVETVNGLTWGEFERLVGEVFRRQGFSVTETGQNGPDGGVDLELRLGKELHLVQCKLWRAQRVGVAVVRELAGVMASRGACGGFVVTSGTFTPDAEAFARGSNITLMGGPELASLIAQAKGSVLVPTPDNSPQTPRSGVLCPLCGSSMVRRIARKGAKAGQDFWGCTRFPMCRGTVDAT